MHRGNCIIQDLVFQRLQSDFIGLPDRKSPIQKKEKIKEYFLLQTFIFTVFAVFLSIRAFGLVFSSWRC